MAFFEEFGGQSEQPNFQRDYWAPDRDQVLSSMGLLDQSGKTFDAGTGQWQNPVTPQPGAYWDENYFRSTFGEPKTPQELLALEQRIQAAGGKVLRNAAGVAGKIVTPDGRTIDVINAAGAGGRGFQWLDGQGGMGGGGTLAGLGYGFGSSMAPWTETWQSPTAQQALDSPGMQFAIDNTMRAMQNNAAARGVVGNGRRQEAIGNSIANNLLFNRYGDVRDWSLGDYRQRQGDFFANQDRPFEKSYSLATLGAPR